MIQRLRGMAIKISIVLIVALFCINASPISFFHYGDKVMIARFWLSVGPLGSLRDSNESGLGSMLAMLVLGLKGGSVLADESFAATNVVAPCCSSKGFAYEPNMQALLTADSPRTPELVESLNPYHSRGGTFEVYRHIAGDWYLYYFNDPW